MRLPQDVLKNCWTIFSGRNNEIFHGAKLMIWRFEAVNLPLHQKGLADGEYFVKLFVKEMEATFELIM